MRNEEEGDRTNRRSVVCQASKVKVPFFEILPPLPWVTSGASGRMSYPVIYRSVEL